MKTVFLGGTCNGSQWRDVLLLTLNASEVSAYNPVVENWTPECQAEEIRQREISDFCLYVLTPKMTGTYSIAEVIDDSNKRPKRTLFLILESDEGVAFNPAQLKSLKQVGKMVEGNGGRWFKEETDLIDFLNAPVVKPTENIQQGTPSSITIGKAIEEGLKTARRAPDGSFPILLGYQGPEVIQQAQERVLLDATVYPSEEKTIVALPTDDKFKGAHNYEIKPMLRYDGGAVYGMEGMPITFVKRNADGTWQPGLQTEQLLHLLIDRHEKMNAVFPHDGHAVFVSHLDAALGLLRMRVNERTARGVMGQSKA